MTGVQGSIRWAFVLVSLVAVATHAKRRHPRGFRGQVAPRLRALPTPPPSGEVAFDVRNFGERVHLNLFNLDGTFNSLSLEALAGAFRCHRTGDRKPIHPQLLEVLSHVYDRYQKPIQLLSGYRNQENVRSYHYQGAAADIRVAGVAIGGLKRFVESLDSGHMGIGLYPRSKFVHVDVRPAPSYRWVDVRPTEARMRTSHRGIEGSDS